MGPGDAGPPGDDLEPSVSPDNYFEYEPPRSPRPEKSAERLLGKGVMRLWDVQQQIIEGWIPANQAERDMMIVLAEGAAVNARRVCELLETGTED